MALTQLGIVDFDKTFMHAYRDLRKQIILTIAIKTDSNSHKKKWQNQSSEMIELKKKIEIEWKEMIVLVEIAFEAATPFGVRSGDGESGEEFGERTRRR